MISVFPSAHLSFPSAHLSATVDGKQVFKWNAGETVTAAAYDNPIPGFGTRNCINLRLWAAKPSKEFDLEAFNTGVCVCVLQATLNREGGCSIGLLVPLCVGLNIWMRALY